MHTKLIVSECDKIFSKLEHICASPEMGNIYELD